MCRDLTGSDKPPDRPCDDATIPEGCLAAHQCPHDSTPETPSDVWALLMAVEELVGGQYHLVIEIDECEVGIGTRSDLPLLWQDSEAPRHILR